MMQPSAVLDAIVARLKAAFLPSADQLAHGTPRVEVRAIDDTVLADVTEYNTVPMPAVLVTCTALPAAPRDYGSLAVEAQFLARCIASRPQSGFSRGDVAMDMAAYVAAVVDEDLWAGSDGEPTALSRASRVVARNLGSRDLASKGLSMWIVTWNQLLELTPRDRDGVLRALRRMHIAVDIEGGTRPDVSGMLELEGREP